MSEFLQFLVGLCVLILLVVLLAPSKEAMKQRYADYCVTAVDTHEHPYAVEQCRLTFEYGLDDVTEWDLLVFHHGRDPRSGRRVTERDELMQAKLHALLPLPERPSSGIFRRNF